MTAAEIAKSAAHSIEFYPGNYYRHAENRISFTKPTLKAGGYFSYLKSIAAFGPITHGKLNRLLNVRKGHNIENIIRLRDAGLIMAADEGYIATDLGRRYLREMMFVAK